VITDKCIEFLLICLLIKDLFLRFVVLSFVHEAVPQEKHPLWRKSRRDRDLVHRSVGLLLQVFFDNGQAFVLHPFPKVRRDCHQ